MALLDEIRSAAAKRIAEAGGLDTLNDIRVNILGKKGELTQLMKNLKDMAPEDRPKFGQLVNSAREEIERELQEARDRIARREREKQLEAESPPFCREVGAIRGKVGLETQ